MPGPRKTGIERYPLCTGLEPDLRPLPKQAEPEFDRYARSESGVIEWICRYPEGRYERWGVFGISRRSDIGPFASHPQGPQPQPGPPPQPEPAPAPAPQPAPQPELQPAPQPQPQPQPQPIPVPVPAVPQESLLDGAVKRMSGWAGSVADGVSRFRAEILGGAAVLVALASIGYGIQRLVRASSERKSPDKAAAEAKAEEDIDVEFEEAAPLTPRTPGVELLPKARAEAPSVLPLAAPPPVDPADMRYAQLVLRIESQLRADPELATVLAAQAEDGTELDHSIEIAHRRVRIAARIATHLQRSPSLFDIVDQRVAAAAYQAEGVAGAPLPTISLAHDSHADPLYQELISATRALADQIVPARAPHEEDFKARASLHEARTRAAVALMAEAMQPWMEPHIDADGTVSAEGVQLVLQRHGITGFIPTDLPVLSLVSSDRESQRGSVNFWFERIRDQMQQRVEHVHRQLRQQQGLELLPAERLNALAAEIVTRSLGVDVLRGTWARTVMPPEGIVAEAFRRHGLDPAMATNLSVDALHADEERGLREEYDNLYRELRRRFGDTPEIASRTQELLLTWHSLNEVEQLRLIDGSLAAKMSITEQLLEEIDLQGLDRSARLPIPPLPRGPATAAPDPEGFRITLDDGRVVDAKAFGELTNLDPVAASEFITSNREAFLQMAGSFDQLTPEEKLPGFERFVAAQMAMRARAQGLMHGSTAERDEERRRGRSERDEPTVKILKGAGK